MKLLYIFTVVLALVLAEEDYNDANEFEDLQAMASNLELMKTDATQTRTSFVDPNRPPSQWHPDNMWVNQQNPQNNNNYYWTTSYPPHQRYSWPQPSTTTQVPIIKNEFYMGNGRYNYEYKLGDGTWVGEYGYYTSPKRDEESLVKQGWYSYVGPDGKTYTVTYYADKTGYHPYGTHFHSPPVTVAPTTQAPHYHHDEHHHNVQHDSPVTSSPAPPVDATKPTYTWPTYPITPAQLPYNPNNRPQFPNPQEFIKPIYTTFYPQYQNQYMPQQKTDALNYNI